MSLLAHRSPSISHRSPAPSGLFYVWFVFVVGLFCVWFVFVVGLFWVSCLMYRQYETRRELQGSRSAQGHHANVQPREPPINGCQHPHISPVPPADTWCIHKYTFFSKYAYTDQQLPASAPHRRAIALLARNSSIGAQELYWRARALLARKSAKNFISYMKCAALCMYDMKYAAISALCSFDMPLSTEGAVA